METPKFAKDLGNGMWLGNQYIISRCPLCGGTNTLKFYGNGLWECLSCKNESYRTLQEFKKLLYDTGTYELIADSMDDPTVPEGLVVVSQYAALPNPSSRIGTGFGPLDTLLGGLGDSELTVLTGKRGGGKSSFAGQMALNAIQNGSKVCFYSGELNSKMFQSWIFSQAAGEQYVDPITDRFGETRYHVSNYAEGRIRAWLGESLILYDNTKNKSSERNSILERFQLARTYYGCNLFFVDNLMTAKYAIDSDRDYYRAQSNFAGQLVDFAQEQAVHVVLIAHPRKGDSGDINDDVSGSGDITNRASNVMQVKRLEEAESRKEGCGTIIAVAKNRDWGKYGKMRMNYNEPSKRLISVDGTNIMKYGWEELC